MHTKLLERPSTTLTGTCMGLEFQVEGLGNSRHGLSGDPRICQQPPAVAADCETEPTVRLLEVQDYGLTFRG